MHRKLNAVLWMISGAFLGSCNDVFTKTLSFKFNPIEISSARSFFAVICLLPFMLNIKKFKTDNVLIHFSRGLIFFIAITLWGNGLQLTHISLAALISFSGPFFLLFMSKIFLKEDFTVPRFLATFVIFSITLGMIDFKDIKFGLGCMYLFIGEIFFSLSDIINKKYSIVENHITMIFYYSLFSFLISFIPTIFIYKKPDYIDLIYMICLGCNSNMSLFCFLRAFSLEDATFLSPFKYLEFVFSVIFSFYLYGTLPTKYSFFAMSVIIISNLCLIFYENRENCISKNMNRGVA